MHSNGFILEQDLKIKDYLSNINKPVKTNTTASKYSIIFFVFLSFTNTLNPLPKSAQRLIVGKQIIAAVIVTNAITIIDNTLLKETQVNSAGENLFAKNSQSGFTKEEFMEMGLKTADRIKNLTSKTLLIKNIHSQRQNLSMLMSGQLYGFALLNFKGNFDLTKK